VRMHRFAEATSLPSAKTLRRLAPPRAWCARHSCSAVSAPVGLAAGTLRLKNHALDRWLLRVSGSLGTLALAMQTLVWGISLSPATCWRMMRTVDME